MALWVSISVFGCNALAGLGNEPTLREDASVDSNVEDTRLVEDTNLVESSVAADADAPATEAGTNALATIGFYNIDHGFGGFGTIDPESGNYVGTWGFWDSPTTPFKPYFDVFAGDPSAVLVHRRAGGDRSIGTLDADGKWTWTGTAPPRAMTQAVALGPGLVASLDGATDCLAIESVTPTDATLLFADCTTKALGFPSVMAGNANGELLGYEIAGKATRAHFDAAKKTLTNGSSDGMAPGWKHVVAVGDSVLCFAKSGEPRRMAMHKLLPKNGIGSEVAIGGDALLEDYTHVVALANGVLFFYGAGLVETGRLEGTTYRRLHSSGVDPISKRPAYASDWDLIFGL